MRSRSFAAVFIGTLAFLLASALAWAGPPVRVLVDEVGPDALMQMNGPHRGYVNGVLSFSTPLTLIWPLQAVGQQVYIDGTPVGQSFTLEPTDGAPLYWGEKSYRGALRFVAVDGGFRVINVLDLETYLRGVVPAEMQASWPLEALKAQAIAARTYTLASLSPNADFDVCATTECQKYKGALAEHPQSDQAILDTAGLVLTYQGDFAKTYYHADSGGALASSAEVWDEVRPYLVSQQDVAHSSPHRSWERGIDPAAVARSLAARGADVGEVRSIRILAYSASGRVDSIEVAGAAGNTVLSGTDLTKLLRGWGLKSTRFNMTGDLRARGDGWGHGVGMSQYGARSLAQAGYSYDQILAFYYPNTDLSKIAYEGTSSP